MQMKSCMYVRAVYLHQLSGAYFSLLPFYLIFLSEAAVTHFKEVVILTFFFFSTLFKYNLNVRGNRNTYLQCVQLVILQSPNMFLALNQNHQLNRFCWQHYLDKPHAKLQYIAILERALTIMAMH